MNLLFSNPSQTCPIYSLCIRSFIFTCFIFKYRRYLSSQPRVSSRNIYRCLPPWPSRSPPPFFGFFVISSPRRHRGQETAHKPISARSSPKTRYVRLSDYHLNSPFCTQLPSSNIYPHRLVHDAQVLFHFVTRPDASSVIMSVFIWYTFHWSSLPRCCGPW